MRKILAAIVLATIVPLGLALASADAQPRGSVSLNQIGPSCNVDNVDLPDPESAGCSLTVVVRNRNGQPLTGQQVRLFKSPDQDVEDNDNDNDDDNDNVQTQAEQFTPFTSSPRTTGRGGTATFTFASPQDQEVCYQARVRNLALNSNILCITPDSTTSIDSNGNETVVAGD